MTRATALRRNQLMIDLAAQVVVGYASHGGMVELQIHKTEKPILNLGRE